MRIWVKVKPNAHEEKVEEQGGFLVVLVKEAPEKGKANEALIRTLAKHYRVRKSCVSILSGHTSRQKLVEVSNQDS